MNNTSCQHRFCVRRGDVLLLTILCIIEVRFFVSSAVLKSPPERKAEKRCRQHIFRTYAESFSPIFSKDFFLKLLPKNFAWYLKTEPNFVDKLCAEITFSGKSVVKLKPETKLCVKIYFVWQFELCRKTLRWVF